MAPQARVLRDGHEWEIEARHLVPGDVVLLETGVRVPADLRIISSSALTINESLLTGESLPVSKHPDTLPEDSPLGDRTNLAYTATIVTGGRGRGYAVATGGNTEIGAIAQQIRETERLDTPLQKRMAEFARVIGVVVVIAAALTFATGIAMGESASEMFLVAVAMAVSAIPEGLPVALTITLTLGVRRMASRNAIVRRLAAVETLGSTTTIGSDKTGTLTQNRMTVQELWADGRAVSLASEDGLRTANAAAELRADQPLYHTLLAGVLTNEATMFITEQGPEEHGDPTELALLTAATGFGIEPEIVREQYDLVVDMPFESERQFSASLREQDDSQYLFVKGAPERVLAMCRSILTASGTAPLDSTSVLEAVHEMGGRGLRVLAMASRVTPVASEITHAVADVAAPDDLVFLGLQGMMDPLRPGVRDAIAGCRDAGMRVVMITGDHAHTARAIGAELGLCAPDAPVLGGSEIETLSDEGLREISREVAVYARVTPEQKLRIVQAMQSRGEVVAVTGDGVNDAPALKAANIGIAMGKSGTDVAREAADMVLADDNFVSIYAAVEEGRVTFDNVRKVTFFLISTGAAEIVTIFAALVLGWPIPFLPAQLLWLNLVTNGLQDVALAFEPGEHGVLQRPPRPHSEGIISSLLWERTVIVGLTMAIGTLIAFRWELDHSGDLEQARSVALTTMVIFQMIHVGNSRSEQLSAFGKSVFSNRFLLIATLAAFTLHAAALYFPPAQFVLRVEPIDPSAWGRALVIGLSVLVASEIHKLLRKGDRLNQPASVSADS